MRVMQVRKPKHGGFRPLRWLTDDRARYTHRVMDLLGEPSNTKMTVVYEFGVTWVGDVGLPDWLPTIVSVDGAEPSVREALQWRLFWVDELAVTVRELIAESREKKEREDEDVDADL